MSEALKTLLPFTPAPAPSPVPPDVANIGEIATELGKTVATALHDIVEPGVADVEAIARDIAPALATAASLGDEELTTELKAQLAGIAEINAIRSGAAVQKAVKAVGSVALKALRLGLKAATGFVLVLALAGCASPGTVDREAVEGLLRPVMVRTNAYAATSPILITQAEAAAYKLAVQKLSELAHEEDRRVPAAESADHVEVVCTIHDVYVTQDTELDEFHRQQYLRSTEILRRIYAAAKTADSDGN